MAPVSSRDDAVELDAQDGLAAFRGRFVFADDAAIYLDGNSLGRLPRATAARLAHVVEVEWGQRLIASWNAGWLDLPLAAGDQIGAAALGAAPGQVAVGDSTTVNLYKLASAALDARPGRTEIVTDVHNFPTDRYVLEQLAGARGLTIRWADPGGCRGGAE
jgi:kynureninase